MDLAPEHRAVLLDLVDDGEDRLTRRERAAIKRLIEAGDELHQLVSGKGATTKNARLEWRRASEVLKESRFGRNGGG